MDRGATSYGFYPGTLFANQVDMPPPMLHSEPKPYTEGHVPPPPGMSEAAGSIPMPRFLRGGAQKQQEREPEGNYHGNYYGRETNYDHVSQGQQGGHANNHYAYYQDPGRGPMPQTSHGLCAQSRGRRDASYFWSNGSTSCSESGRSHDDYYQPHDPAPRGAPQMQRFETGYARSEAYNRPYYYQPSGYQYSYNNENYRKESYMQDYDRNMNDYDRNEVMVTGGRSQETRRPAVPTATITARSSKTTDGSRTLRLEEKREGSQAGSVTSASELAPEEPPLEELVSGSLTNAGAVWHAMGRCIPCKFFRSKSGCKGGLDCEFCHYRHQELSRSQLRSRFKRAHYKYADGAAGPVKSSPS
eukprot:TRINITY_DN21820_c0_g1_i1.p1 TRINITY_DN21820_c0_g1~~TRINITY_DN21820_c0_g1_i1.p1  ORF type:complete len:358 (+),score=52.53 TRINITY_DN21820_c0_g1_i1:108-1181(+)